MSQNPDIPTDHFFQLVRRQISESRPDLKVFFIVHSPGKRAEALRAKRHEMELQPGGDKLYPLLAKLSEKEGSAPSVFAGMVQVNRYKWLPRIAGTDSVSAFFINSAHFTTGEDARFHAYSLIWHILDLLDAHEKNDTSRLQISEGIIRPKHSQNGKRIANILADAFAAFYCELTGQRGSIKTLARRRSLLTVSPVPYYQPENFPFPVALDAATIVYQETPNFIQAKARPLEGAWLMTREVATTLDEAHILQWQSFSRAAQEMAWMNIKKEKILGAAVYTNEDPYVRSIAFMIAEILNTQPEIDIHFRSYNAFTDQEVNERHHNKSCEETFSQVLQKVMLDHTPVLLKHEAFLANRMIFSGDPVGWCAWPLLKAAAVFDAHPDTPIHTLDKDARETFNAALANYSWQTVLDVSAILIEMRRDSRKVTAEAAIEELKSRENPAYLPFIKSFALNTSERTGQLRQALAGTSGKTAEKSPSL